MEETEEYIKNRALSQTKTNCHDNYDNNDNSIKIKIKTMDNSIF